MDQNQNNDLFDNDNPPPQSNEPNQTGSGARIYQTGPGAAPSEPVYTPPPAQPAYNPPPPPKKSNTVWIIAVVVVLLLCCCCLLAAGAWLWNNGDALLDQLDLSMRPLLSLLA
jgi:hypothetical protein